MLATKIIMYESNTMIISLQEYRELIFLDNKIWDVLWDYKLFQLFVTEYQHTWIFKWNHGIAATNSINIEQSRRTLYLNILTHFVILKHKYNLAPLNLIYDSVKLKCYKLFIPIITKYVIKSTKPLYYTKVMRCI